ncbi:MULTISPECIES: DUF5799 family protein [Haloferax]|jgi:hypothetical protein|uniref:Uncharacterized protein n=4 Tax=Haloferax TaxID=2251 RepID=A0A6C0USU8_HALVO|nr:MULTISPECIES: DUF5799 family protein [Haloferax]ELZ74600.1 hypothetical protein C456_09533 [Haloferax lucentense DSM 14919]ELZ93876.1 hypothetical protein C452_03342 [Haloferax alexandrinus JCM 10717]MBC9986243.1 hypothetical protein [Haloferax sp. AS1]NLV02396.1 hypothetical protein [Haloferax alexandrinus]QIB78565.1 hypothetical protein G3A49_10615 [Haloferax alexandrinus]
MAHWTDSIVGDRMTVDREFNEQVTNSRFNSQEWGLIMTATEFEIENADDPEAARIVADTEKVPQIIPELDNIRSQMGAMGGGGGESSSDGGIVDSIKGALGMGGGGKKGEQEKLEAAERLTQEYADALQDHLEKKGKWNQVRVSYLE